MGNDTDTANPNGGTTALFAHSPYANTTLRWRAGIGERIAGLSFAVLSTLAMLFSVGANAQQFLPVQTYFVPIPESQMSQALEAVDPDDTSDCIISIVSIAAGADGTVIVFDRESDGYEPSLTDISLFSATTEVWGDGDPSNGDVCATDFRPTGSCSNDTINSGNVIVLQNNVSVGNDSCNANLARFDVNGGDKFSSTQAVAVTRLGWADPNQKTLLAGAIEVYPTLQWGVEFQLPAGEDTNTDGSSPDFVGGASSPELFECTVITVMAAEDDTEVTIDTDGVGPPEASQTLNQGESLQYGVTGTDTNAECGSISVPAGTRVSSTKPVQVDMLTGDIGADYEMRWYTLFPREQWSSTYFNPVGTNQGVGTIADPNQPTNLYIFNPNNAEITVDFLSATSMSSVMVPAGGVAGVSVPAGDGRGCVVLKVKNSTHSRQRMRAPQMRVRKVPASQIQSA